MNIIEVKNLKKNFGETQALKGVSLSVKEGSIYALLGPNGAGKTTLIRTLATLLLPDGGSAQVKGFDVVAQPEEVRKVIGLAGQFAAVDDFMTGRETLEMVGRLYGLPHKAAAARAEEILEQLSLTDAADRTAKTYSGGMRRRLDLGASLVVAPDVIFLDEPTTGLDPRTRLELWEVIRNLARNGRTILLTTQYLEEADALANYIMVIDNGTIATEGTASQLKDSLGQDIVEIRVKEKDAPATQALLAKLGSVTEDQLMKSFRIPATNKSATLLAAAEALKAARIEPIEISLHRPSLDDVFLAVTGHRAESTAPSQKGSKRGFKKGKR